MSSLLDLKGLVGDLTSHCELTDGEPPKISKLKTYRNPKNAVNFSNRTVNRLNKFEVKMNGFAKCD